MKIPRLEQAVEEKDMQGHWILLYIPNGLHNKARDKNKKRKSVSEGCVNAARLKSSPGMKSMLNQILFTLYEGKHMTFI